MTVYLWKSSDGGEIAVERRWCPLVVARKKTESMEDGENLNGQRRKMFDTLVTVHCRLDGEATGRRGRKRQARKLTPEEALAPSCSFLFGRNAKKES